MCQQKNNLMSSLLNTNDTFIIISMHRTAEIISILPNTEEGALNRASQCITDIVVIVSEI